MCVVGNVELLTTLLISKTHLHHANAICDRRIDKDRGCDVGGRTDHQHCKAFVTREPPRCLKKKLDRGTGSGRLRIIEWPTASFNQRRMTGNFLSVLNHLDKYAVGSLTCRCSDRRRMCRHHAKYFEPRLK